MNEHIRDFTATKVTRHRNGISGTGFYSVEFCCVIDGMAYPRMLAVIPDGGNAHGPDVGCFVVDMTDTTQNWRGASFVLDVQVAIAFYQKTERSNWNVVRINRVKR
jgi:hypothetical protein